MSSDPTKHYLRSLSTRLETTESFLDAVKHAIALGEWSAAHQSAQSLAMTVALMANDLAVLYFMSMVHLGHYEEIRKRKK